MPEKIEQPKTQPDVFEKIRAWALKTELTNGQKHYLDLLVVKLNKILTDRTVESMSAQKDLAGLESYLQIVTKINQLLKEKFVSPEDSKFIFEDDVLDFIENWCQTEDINKVSDMGIGVLNCLAGLDSERAWQIREQYKDKYPKQIIASLAGLDNERAWRLRDEVKLNDSQLHYLAISLAGLDTERAWEIRNNLISSKSKKSYTQGLLTSLAGIDTEQSWQMRDKLWEIGGAIGPDNVAESLAGTESDQAWLRRNKYNMDGAYYRIFLSLKGMDSEKAWGWRNKCFEKELNDMDKGCAAISLAGIDTEQAWQLREKLIKEGVEDFYIADSLAGLASSRAWQLRESLRESLLAKDNTRIDFFRSINADFALVGLHKVMADRAAKDKEAENE